ncbi:MAG: hypothetical protein KF763_04295 [Cyclobacteriaceae bacterium]|nr:hypothetical protein [Cyclobacteriaceae bacterium]
MRVIKLALLAGILGLVASCFTPPEFPVEPRIEFENMIYKRVDGIDSLIFFINFTDGDGDLGLQSSETRCTLNSDNNQICFNNKIHDLYQNTETGEYGIVDTGVACSKPSLCFNSKFVILKPDRSRITYHDKVNNPNYSNLPAFQKPFNCTNWEILRNNGVVVDTSYYELNSNHHNFDIDFLVKNPNGTFSEFDFTKEFDFPNCGITYNGRFPVLFTDRPGSPMEGRIRFGIGSPAFRAQFSLKTLKFRIQITDRALNKSNVIETPEITF